MQSILDPTPTQPQARCAADLEAAASMLSLLHNGSDVRERKVRRVRAAVRVETYENSLKLAIAIDRLIAVLEI